MSAESFSALIELLPMMVVVGAYLFVPMVIGILVAPARTVVMIGGLAAGIVVSVLLAWFYGGWLWDQGNDNGSAMISGMVGMMFPFSVLTALLVLSFRVHRLETDR